ncbi:hypothetical protein L5515_005766 [Caenorhabditis briggsae]|uniref:BTB domain-containing protein n=1 Tax=Caenorhabditis briggsae TaxID=6238 RepID=A0AAE9EXP9_CAEBR|nr:hypothetical protein L5515_005766 [Caenorhabditis briggsae]
MKATVVTNLFTKTGHLKPPVTVEHGGYTWTISLEYSEVRNIPAIDFMLQCDGIQDGKYVAMRIEFLNFTKSTHQTFYFVFEPHRNRFCYRRICTGVRHVNYQKGKTVASFPINRFMCPTSENTAYEAPSPQSWIFHNLVTWNVLNDGRVETTPCKILYDKFQYGLVLDKAFDTDTLDLETPSYWPHSYDEMIEFVEPNWPDMSHTAIEYLWGESTEYNKQTCFDMLGACYHKWRFDDKKLYELNEFAYNLKFFQFMDGIGIGGGFEKICSASTSADIIKIPRPPKQCCESLCTLYHAEWNVRRIPKSGDLPSIFKIFMDQNMQWNMSFFHSTFRNQTFLSIGGVLVGDIKRSCVCSLEVSLDSKQGKITRKFRRRLNKTQNTICFPMFCKKEDVNSEGNIFHVNFEFQEVDGWNDEDYLNDVKMPEPNDVVLKLQDKRIAVNKTFLAHHAQFFSGLLFNENFHQHDKAEVEIHSIGFKEMLDLLDALYHGTKLFDVSKYYHILQKSDEWICEKVRCMMEKAINNTNCQSVNKQKLREKFKMNLVEKFSEENKIEKRGMSGDASDEPSPDAKKERVEEKNDKEKFV